MKMRARSFDSTMRSNLSVGIPLTSFVTNAMPAYQHSTRFAPGDAYFTTLISGVKASVLSSVVCRPSRHPDELAK